MKEFESFSFRMPDSSIPTYGDVEQEIRNRTDPNCDFEIYGYGTQRDWESEEYIVRVEYYKWSKD